MKYRGYPLLFATFWVKNRSCEVVSAFDLRYYDQHHRKHQVSLPLPVTSMGIPQTYICLEGFVW